MVEGQRLGVRADPQFWIIADEAEPEPVLHLRVDLRAVSLLEVGLGGREVLGVTFRVDADPELEPDTGRGDEAEGDVGIGFDALAEGGQVAIEVIQIDLEQARVGPGLFAVVSGAGHAEAGQEPFAVIAGIEISRQERPQGFDLLSPAPLADGLQNPGEVGVPRHLSEGVLEH